MSQCLGQPDRPEIRRQQCGEGSMPLSLCWPPSVREDRCFLPPLLQCWHPIQQSIARLSENPDDWRVATETKKLALTRQGRRSNGGDKILAVGAGLMCRPDLSSRVLAATLPSPQTGTLHPHCSREKPLHANKTTKTSRRH